MESLTELFCLIDDFCMGFELSELMTLAVLFYQLRFRQFKSFYLAYACRFLRKEFPDLPSYQRCVELMPRCVVPLAALFDALKAQCSGISIVDSTPIAVCDNLRIARHKVFAGLAARGKSSTGWFFGFKLHVVINHRGEILAIRLTPGNVDDRKPVPKLCQSLFGKLFGDKGYLAKWLSEMLAEQDVHLITKVRKNMKPIELTPFDQALLRQRSLIETVFDELKNLCQIEHTRHRSCLNFVVNLMELMSNVVYGCSEVGIKRRASVVPADFLAPECHP
jgi:transposase